MTTAPASGSKWTVRKPNGRIYELTQQNGLRVTAYDGVDIPAVTGYSQALPQMVGELDQGFTLPPRDWFVTVLLRTTRANYHYVRRLLNEAFRPEQAESTMLISLPDLSQYAIDFRVTGSMLTDNGRSEGTSHAVHRAVAPLRSSNPTFYEPNPIEVSFYPFLLVGNQRPFPYAGSWSTRPNMRLNGPISDPLIENADTLEKLPFGGLTLAEGQWVDVTLAGGNISLKNHLGQHVDGFLDDDNDLATFHLAYEGEQRPSGCYTTGTNTIRVTGGGMTPATRLDVTYYRRFIGF